MISLFLLQAATSAPAGSPAGAQGPSGPVAMLVQMAPLILIFGVFYFLLIRPQQKKQKEHKEMLTNLQKGDSIFTAGGIHGKITGLTDTTITLEVADKVRVKINRSAVGGLLKKGEATDKESE